MPRLEESSPGAKKEIEESDASVCRNNLRQTVDLIG